MLKIENLTKKFDDKTIIDAINVHVNKGEIAVFLGSSGVGKSTLLRILNNLETPDTGKFFLDNKLLDISTVNKTHTIGMVFQNFNLFEHLTVQENITLPLEVTAHKNTQEAQQIAHEFLQLYGLADKKLDFIAQLSGGQKQRLALARTLALKPKVVCLDEPTSALDPYLTTYVATTIQDLARRGYIILVATHDTMLLEKLNCTIYLMEQGKIVEHASSESFYADKNKYPQIKKFVLGS